MTSWLRGLKFSGKLEAQSVSLLCVMRSMLKRTILDWKIDWSKQLLQGFHVVLKSLCASQISSSFLFFYSNVILDLYTFKCRGETLLILFGDSKLTSFISLNLLLVILSLCLMLVWLLSSLKSRLVNLLL